MAVEMDELFGVVAAQKDRQMEHLEAERALVLLARWATRRAQRVAKERSDSAVSTVTDEGINSYGAKIAKN
jgi:hypothetical protein